MAVLQAGSLVGRAELQSPSLFSGRGFSLRRRPRSEFHQNLPTSLIGFLDDSSMGRF